MSRAALLFVVAGVFVAAQDSRPESRPVDPAQDIAFRILKEVETVRGIPMRSKPSIATHDMAEMRRLLLLNLDRDFPPTKRDALSRAYKAFGLLPRDYDVAKEFVDLLTEQIAGYYDPEAKALRLIAREGGGDGASPFGDGGPSEDEVVTAHELVHALQDEAFDLQSYGAPDDAPDSDVDAASLALVEGDATLAMTAWMFSKQGMDASTVFSPFARLMMNAASSTASAGGLPGAEFEKFAAAPPIFRDGLMFSYLEGAKFCMAIAAKEKSFAAIDAAFRDPPRSTEQILHPERYSGPKRDDPVSLILPDLSKLIGDDATRVAADGLGEFGCRILFEDALAPPADEDAGAARKRRRLAERVADGWDGDRYEVYGRKNARDVLVWASTWDSTGDAVEVVDRLGAIRVQEDDVWFVARVDRDVVVVAGMPAQTAAPLAITVLSGTRKVEMTKATRRRVPETK